MSPKYSAQERLKLIRRVLLGKEPVSKVCQEVGISRTLFYRWLKKYHEAGKSVEALTPGKKKPPISPKKVTPQQEEQILAIVKKHPSWSTKKISAALPRDPSGKPIVGNHGVQNVLQRHDLSTKEKRIAYCAASSFAYVKEISKPKEEKVVIGVKLSPEQKLEMLERVVIGKEKVGKVCKEYGISRTLFYRLKKRYEEAALEEKLRAVTPAVRYIKRYWRQTPERYEQAVLDLAVKHPEYSVRKIVEHLPEIAGIPIVGHHGVQNILGRHNLSLYEQRLAYSQAQVTPVTRLILTIEEIGTRFIVLPVEIRAAIIRFFSVTALTAFSTVVVLGGLGYLATITAGVPVPSRIGLFFATIAIGVGSVFFAYSMKYYLTLAVVLSFSRQPLEEGGGYVVGLNGRLNNNHRNGNGRNWLQRIFGIGNGNGNGNGERREMVQAGGLQPSLEHIKLKRYPFISIHLPFYNEKKVAERILAACVSMDYSTKGGQAQFEVIVCDDSTDETINIVNKFAQEHNKANPNGPKIKVLHRPTRQGFKGGALRETLRASDPRAEFVVVFDADFIPYPDTLELFIKYFKANNNNNNSEDYSKSNIAVVGGYQWHVLNKSENWVTRGVRAEYAGSYVIERPGTEILGLLKQISGSVYMIRSDILKKFGWGTSITEDFELTLRLYEAGYKIIYTPYIQGPAECVSTLKRLIRQRMRWAEGHSNNIKRMFFRLIISPKLTLMEKLEVLYLSPYYLQAFFFLVGTFSWLMAETVFRARLPFWTSLWGWSLVLTNFFSLPLMNAVGLFLEESEEKDYLGILSFVALSYIMVPFQAYASVKGFLEKQEGPWFRTPKTGKITDVFTRGKFYRWLTGIIPGRRAAPVVATVQAQGRLNPIPYTLNPYLALATANNQFNNFTIRPKRLRWVSKAALAILLVFSVTILSLSQGVREVEATNWTNLYTRQTTTHCTGLKDMETTAGTAGAQITFQAIGEETCWYSEVLPTESGDGNMGAGPWSFHFHGSWGGGTTGDSLTIAAQVALVDDTSCGSPSSEDSGSIIYTKNTTFPTTHSITLTNLASTAITAADPKRIRVCLEVTGEAKTGLVYFNYDSATNDSYLAPSTLTIPERLVLLLIVMAPFIPMIVLWLRRKRGIRVMI